MSDCYIDLIDYSIECLSMSPPMQFISPEPNILKYRIEGDMPEQAKQCDGCGGRQSIIKNNKKQCVFCGNDL